MSVYSSDLSTDNLNYLSSEQALADLAHFRLYMSDKLQLTDNKWIAFGGSYPGVNFRRGTITVIFTFAFGSGSPTAAQHWYRFSNIPHCLGNFAVSAEVFGTYQLESFLV